jgi:predicted metal-dependent hydrolase
MNGKERGYLIRACTDYTLQVTPRLLTLPPEKQDKILKHEAIHMGYGNHDSKFMELADIVGASYTESSLDSKVRI